MMEIGLVVFSLALTSVTLATSSSSEVTEGHWLEVRGNLSSNGVFVADKAEVLLPQPYDVLIGTITNGEGRDDRREDLFLLGEALEFSRETRFRVDRERLVGNRVKVEGFDRGPERFLAEKVSARGAGRDRVGGRVEELRHTEGGTEVRILHMWVRLPPFVEHELPLADIPLASAVSAAAQERVDEDDLFGRGIALSRSLRFTGQLELESTREGNFNLNVESAEDRTDYDGSARLRLEWSPDDRWGGVFEVRTAGRHRNDEEDGTSTVGTTRFGQTWLYVRDPWNLGTYLYIGRQDFDEAREWVFDKNLDAIRLVALRERWRFDLSVSTILSDGGPRDLASTNWIAYLSNNDRKRHLGGYVIRRDFNLEPLEHTTHLGISLDGEWLPALDSWLDAAILRGHNGLVAMEGWGFDVGSTWSTVGPLALTAGYAFGSGDDSPENGDRTFRQTGFQDNSAKFAGVTSFRYYGELVDPELANLRILTLGMGARLAERTSLDFVYHRFEQDKTTTTLISELDRRPNGLDRRLGWEADLIFGSRSLPSWDIEVVGGFFRPGPAFRHRDDAVLARFQVRYRF
ncbi:MAG TPA: alginate export family protein [Vicinamibacteria bacterium]|nr:alginate export family protein [Vicinamibacteria bacterium]